LHDTWDEYRHVANTIKSVFSKSEVYDFTDEIKLITVLYAMMSITDSKTNDFKTAYRQVKIILYSDELKWAFKKLKIPKNISLNQKIYFYLVKLRLTLFVTLIK
jgi:hypothetical protein